MTAVFFVCLRANSFRRKRLMEPAAPWPLLLPRNLAKGKTIPDAIEAAKHYTTEAIRHGLALGKGNGPTDHFYFLQS